MLADIATALRKFRLWVYEFNHSIGLSLSLGYDLCEQKTIRENQELSILGLDKALVGYCGVPGHIPSNQPLFILRNFRLRIV